MNPSSPIPRSLEEFRQEPRPFQFAHYVKRFGGYQQERLLGLLMHMLSQVTDLLLSGEVESALDHLALLHVFLEQTAQDGGRTDVSFTLSLFPDPPPQVFQKRQTEGGQPVVPLATLPGPGATTRALGLALVGPPKEKRIALAAITLEAARLPKTTDRLHLCLVGAWVSGLLYRRPLMSLLQSAFSLVDTSTVCQSSSRLLPLPRRVAEELVMLSALSHLLVADVSAPWADTLCATDSSEHKGAIASAPVDPSFTRVLWTSSQKASESTRLISRVRAALQRLDPMHEESSDSAGSRPSIRRPLALRFHFLEICGGSSKISAFLRSQGWLVGPPLDLSFSSEYNLLNDRVFLWVVHLLESGLLDSLFISPPCTTFSIAAHPPLRSYAQPYGFRPSESRTRIGNVLAHRALALIATCLRLSLPGALAQPRASKMARLRAWLSLRRHAGITETFTVGCSFGMPHLKPWRFLAACLCLDRVSRKCSRDHTHIPISGQHARASAVYPDAFAEEIGKAYEVALRLRLDAESALEIDTCGLESPLVNDAASSLDWEPVASWKWGRSTHIHVLETASFYRLVSRLAPNGPLRFCSLCDSSVARCSVSKGRSFKGCQDA